MLFVGGQTPGRGALDGPSALRQCGGGRIKVINQIWEYLINFREYCTGRGRPSEEMVWASSRIGIFNGVE